MRSGTVPVLPSSHLSGWPLEQASPLHQVRMNACHEAPFFRLNSFHPWTPNLVLFASGTNGRMLLSLVYTFDVIVIITSYSSPVSTNGRLNSLSFSRTKEFSNHRVFTALAYVVVTNKWSTTLSEMLGNFSCNVTIELGSYMVEICQDYFTFPNSRWWHQPP